ncbi:MAG: YhbY family RNA-binding protein [Promethearchaeota archaeon]
MGYQDNFKKVLLGESHIILGKNGATSEVVEYVSRLLKRYKIIKIKALRSIANKYDIKEIASQVTNKTDSYLLDLRGKTFLISQNPPIKKAD